MMSDDSESESGTERDPEDECAICLKGISKRSTTPCKHSYCYVCLKKWAEETLQVNAAGGAEARCPMCRQTFGSFTHHYKTKFKLYPPGQGPAGIVKHRRRNRKRGRPKKNGAAH